ncbi:tetratricopeptide repeat protein [Pseudomonas sp. 5P_5.1_Bac1]|uniref:tetratricopeptide repeat protein n=1 Tax=Pseudomonas sp. 5P_5.1_Bac1 TaxID=2971616 RepID=UPI0021CABAEA|nr:tetratricopeptide repeat protein [Pseudomonas sp. 5P_5.1_Bac1]MCU1720441.1 tetratricopeptide repeat protein [Pseudomonas sp. 5P_5.1_Bac1]
MPLRAHLHCLTLLLILASPFGAADPRPPSEHLSDGYVAQARCTACHQTQASAWANSHHSWSLREANSENVLGDFNDTTFSDADGIRMRFFKRGERFFVNAEGEDGKPADFAIAYTFGFDPLQQYLIERPGGRLQSLTVAWDSRPGDKGGQRWFSLHPGQRFTPDDALHWTGRYQNWNAMCADCHSGNLRKGYDPASDTFQTTWSEMAVGCQSCHGPGQRHLDWAEQHPDKPSPAMSPAQMGLAVDFHRAEPGYLVEQCARCHSRRQPLGNGSQPGKPLLDAMRPAVLSDGLYHADGQILDEVFEYGSFTQSKMFAKGVTCSNCHEPHSTTLRAEGNDLCKACHNPVGNPRFPSLVKQDYDTPQHHHHSPGTPGAQCVSCHMPTRTYMGVDARRDHALRIPRPDLDGTTGAPDACTACHQDKPPTWAASAIEGWFGQPKREPHYGETFAAARRHDPSVIPQLAKLIEDAGKPAIVRASAVELGAGYGDALQPSLVKALGDDSPQVRLQAARALEGQTPAQRLKYLLPLLQDPSLAVRDQAARGLADQRSADLAQPVADRLEAQLNDHLERLRENTDLPAARLNLAVLQERLNRPVDAIDNYRQALKQDSRYVPARTGLARLLMAQGQVAETEQLLRTGLELQPQQPELAYSLGLVLGQQGKNDEAITWLQRADGPRAQYNLGLLLSRMGRTEEARAAFLKGLEQDRDNPDLRYGLAYLSARAGRTDEALGYCDGSPDPRCQRLIRAIQARSR